MLVLRFNLQFIIIIKNLSSTNYLLFLLGFGGFYYYFLFIIIIKCLYLLSAGGWCFKFDYLMFGPGNQTTLQLKALIVNVREENPHPGSEDITDSQQSNTLTVERSSVDETNTSTLKRALNLEDEQSFDLDDDSSSTLSKNVKKDHDKREADDYIIKGAEIHNVKETDKLLKSSAKRQRKTLLWKTSELSKDLKHVEISVKSTNVFKVFILIVESIPV